MRKTGLFFAVALFFLAHGVVFSEELAAPADEGTAPAAEQGADAVPADGAAPRDYMHEASLLLDEKGGLKKNRDAVKDIAFHLSPAQKENLYDNFKVGGAVRGVAMNWIPGFGGGSYSQGDKVGGTIILVSDVLTTCGVVAGVGFGLAGLVVLIFEAPIAAISGDSADDAEALLTAAGVSFLVGAGLWVCARIFGTVRPVAYQRSHNKQLKDALLLNKNVGVAPVLNPVSKDYGLVATIRL